MMRSASGSPAQLGDAEGVFGRVRDPGVVRTGHPQGAVEEPDRVIHEKNIQVQQTGVQHTEGVPGRHDGACPTVRGQQGPGLLVGGRVVDHHEDAAALLRVRGEDRGVQPLPVLHAVRDVLAGHAQRPQESLQRLCGLDAACVVVAEHVDEQHAAGEPASVPGGAGRLEGEFGLADAGQAADRGDDHDRSARTGGRCSGGRVQPAQQDVEMGVPADEHGGRGRESVQRRRHLWR